MTWLLWLGVCLAVLALAAVGLTAFGERRWAGEMKALHAKLEAGRLDGKSGAGPLPTRYDARELVGLPAPVQRYFRAVLKDGHPIITAVTIDIAGTFNMSPTGEQWKPFTSHQRIVTNRPGFLWDAKIAMLPGVKVHVVDSYIVGHGLRQVAANSWRAPQAVMRGVPTRQTCGAQRCGNFWGPSGGLRLPACVQPLFAGTGRGVPCPPPAKSRSAAHYARPHGEGIRGA